MSIYIIHGSNVGWMADPLLAISFLTWILSHPKIPSIGQASEIAICGVLREPSDGGRGSRQSGSGINVLFGTFSAAMTTLHDGLIP